MESITAWPQADLDRLWQSLNELHQGMLATEHERADDIAAVPPRYATSARNLLHYLHMRQHDVRDLQAHLTALGLSSLGRSEGNVLGAVERVLYWLRLRQQAVASSGGGDEPFAPSHTRSLSLLERHAEELLGPRHRERHARIMVTMPSEAASDYSLVRDLLDAGMDLMRINCAHDDVSAWQGMVENLRRAERETARICRVHVELAGSKLRTGALPNAPSVRSFGPQRGPLGQVLFPARVWLTTPDGAGSRPAGADAVLPAPSGFLQDLVAGDKIVLYDARGKKRMLVVTATSAGGCWAEAIQKTYVQAGARLRCERTHHHCTVPEFPPETQAAVVRPGDILRLLHPHVRPSAVLSGDTAHEAAACIVCEEPAVFSVVEPGEHIYFDDGKIGGIVQTVTPNTLDVLVTSAQPHGSKLRPGRGINLPDSRLEFPALTDADLAHLDFVAAHADIVGLSYAQRAEDLDRLRAELAERTRRALGVILKIETRLGFERLPRLLLAALRHMPAGIMVARGDLGVELGFERLAEVQEEILWLCEAAHLPVIWATQVLERMAKKGYPSRAEVTDAAMSGRAECVMLNKGPHLTDAVRFLGQVLRRMQAHQRKKQSMMRRLAVCELR